MRIDGDAGAAAEEGANHSRTVSNTDQSERCIQAYGACPQPQIFEVCPSPWSCDRVLLDWLQGGALHTIQTKARADDAFIDDLGGR